MQYPDSKEVNDRGKILAKDDGTVSYRGILPTAYPIVRSRPLCNSGPR